MPQYKKAELIKMAKTKKGKNCPPISKMKKADLMNFLGLSKQQPVVKRVVIKQGEKPKPKGPKKKLLSKKLKIIKAEEKKKKKFEKPKIFKRKPKKKVKPENNEDKLYDEQIAMGNKFVEMITKLPINKFRNWRDNGDNLFNFLNFGAEINGVIKDGDNITHHDLFKIKKKEFIGTIQFSIGVSPEVDIGLMPKQEFVKDHINPIAKGFGMKLEIKDLL